MQPGSLGSQTGEGSVLWPGPLLPLCAQKAKHWGERNRWTARDPDETSLRRPPVQRQLVLGFSSREFTQLGNEIGLQAT